MIHAPAAKETRVSDCTPAADFRVTAIGSCRLIGPLRAGQKDAEYSLNQVGVYGYCHSAAEATQQLRVLQGEQVLPDHLRPVLAPGYDVDCTREHKTSDLYVIEICSAKELYVDDHLVQLNYLKRHFEGFFSDRARSREFWKLSKPGEILDKAQFLAGLPEFGALSASDQHILRELRLGETSASALRQNVEEIMERSPDTLIVTHFKARKHDGSHLKNRSDFINLLSSELRDLGVQFFDPSDYVEATGQNIALADQGSSLSHYSQRFEEFLAHHWNTRYIEPRRQSKVGQYSLVPRRPTSAGFQSPKPPAVSRDPITKEPARKQAVLA